MELFFQLLIMAIGYAVGVVPIVLLKFAGLAFTFNSAAMLVLLLPVMSALMTEGLTGLWDTTPGTVGLGGLVAFLPMLVAGLISAFAAVIAQKYLAPLDPYNPRSSEGLTGWIVVAIVCTIMTLALWRFWPEPRARLW